MILLTVLQHPLCCWVDLHLLYYSEEQILYICCNYTVSLITNDRKCNFWHKALWMLYQILLSQSTRVKWSVFACWWARGGSRLMERGGQNELRLSGLVQNEFQKKVRASKNGCPPYQTKHLSLIECIKMLTWFARYCFNAVTALLGWLFY